eukprot:7387807-Prymnesium_polylepis.2
MREGICAHTGPLCGADVRIRIRCHAQDILQHLNLILRTAEAHACRKRVLLFEKVVREVQAAVQLCTRTALDVRVAERAIARVHHTVLVNLRCAVLLRLRHGRPVNQAVRARLQLLLRALRRLAAAVVADARMDDAAQRLVAIHDRVAEVGEPVP